MIRGQKRPLSKNVKDIHEKVKFNIHNRFDFEVVDSRTGEVKHKAYAENIVLDSLWPRLLAPNTYFNYIFFGTGTGALDRSRNNLFSRLAYKEATNKAMTYDFNNGWVSSRKRCQLSEAEYVGAQLSEVGIGYGTSDTNLVTHALLKDMNGNVITIAKTDIDIVNIYATVFMHWNVNGYGNIRIAPVEENHLFTYLLGDSAAVPAIIQYYYGAPSSAGADAINTRTTTYIGEKSTTLSYDANGKKISIAQVSTGAEEYNNVYGIKGINFILDTGNPQRRVPSLLFKYPFVDTEKSTIVGEPIGTGDGVQKDFETKFPFIKPGAKIYLDGIECSDVIIDTLLPKTPDEMGAYFELIAARQGSAYRQSVLSFSTTSDGLLVFGTSYGKSYATYYNPYYMSGIESLYKSSGYIIEASEDLIAWSLISPSGASGTINIQPYDKHKKYWRIEYPQTGTNYYQQQCRTVTTSSFTAKHIHFHTAPPEGAVITADYDCEVIAKDENHVFYFSFEITLGEKTV